MNRIQTNRTHKQALLALRSIVTMAVILTATILLTEILWLHFSFARHNLVLLYVMSVLVISCTHPGYVYGLVSAIIAALACDFLIVAPRYEFSFSIGSPLTLATLLLVTLISSTMASRLRQQKKLALHQQEHFETLYTINRELLSARSIPAIVKLINASLETHVKRPVIFFTGDPMTQPEGNFWLQPETPETTSLFLSDAERRKVHALFQGDESPYGAKGEPERFFYQRLMTAETVAGVIGIDCGDRPLSPDEIAYVHTLSGQAALAFEVQRLSDRQEKLLVDAEKEKTRAVLLRSISHDFRTPVATIRGASAAIREHPDMPPDTREKLLLDIEEYADWLTLTMENILTITRLSDESLQIRKVSEAAEEVISSAVERIRKRYPDRVIQIKIPDTLLFVPMDTALISQVLMNLLENALKNSPPASVTVVRLQRKDDAALFQVEDEGDGIPPQLANDLFRSYLSPGSQSGDAFRGNGIGLSICKTIVNAHHGVLEGHNKATGGAVFSFTLPLEESVDEL